MNEQQALERMISPGQKRPKKQQNGVMQIWVTRACDKACFGCTQGSNLAGKVGMITPEQFEVACRSLRSYFGVIGMFGGNPAIHPQFETLCDILCDYFPKKQRGLWCNNPLGKGSTMRQTFNPGASNLNVHLDQSAYDEFKQDWPECKPIGLHEDSRHSPPYVAMQDVIEDPAERWELISNCDINQKWSAMVCVFRGELRGFFCEIAGAQAMLHQHEQDYPDLGLVIKDDMHWWKRPMSDFASQVNHHCHACGVPLRGHGELAQAVDGAEQVSETHADIYRSKRKGRQVELVTLKSQLGKPLKVMTNYIQNSREQ